jgi:predicted ferric reductase
MWIRHGGLRDLGSLSAQLTAAGQLTALYGTYIALIQIVLMSRSPWLDQLFGMDRLSGWHRWLGFACLWLLVGHTVLTTAGYALGDGSGLIGESWALVSTYPYVLMAWVGLGLFALVAVTSVRIARRRLS